MMEFLDKNPFVFIGLLFLIAGLIVYFVKDDDFDDMMLN